MTSEASLAGSKRPKFVAFYLPQFHPIPENDEWWGKGFTEWTNTAKAKPLYEGHYQPHLPADLGFYDLRVRETRLEQIAMAKAYGIDAFCYHYYWFSGRRILERPINEMLADPAMDMPFCFCWANENWSRRWDAADHEVLLAQQYLPDDDLRFIEEMTKAFRDPRYLRIEGAPLLIVYRPQHLPNAKRSLEIWRRYCASIGISNLHLAAAMTHGNWDFKQYGFDSGVEFPPHNVAIRGLNRSVEFHEPFSGYLLDYPEVAAAYLQRSYSPASSAFRTVFPSWDNTARRNHAALIIANGTPENYEYWLKLAVDKTMSDFPGQERLVFINAWNEWAEGCHLEPDQKYGRAFLEATKRVKLGSSVANAWSHKGVPSRSQTGWQRRIDTLHNAGVLKTLGLASRSALRNLKQSHAELQENYHNLVHAWKHSESQVAKFKAYAQSTYRIQEDYEGLGSRTLDVVREPMSSLPGRWVFPSGKHPNAWEVMSAEQYQANCAQEVPGHQKFRSDLSCGSDNVSIPEKFLARQSYMTVPQNFKQFDNPLFFSEMAALMHKPGRFVQETVAAASAFRQDLTNIPGVIDEEGAIKFNPGAVGAIPRVEVPCLVSTHASSLAYGHWWFDTMPSVWIWREALRKKAVSLLMPNQALAWTHACLDLLNIPADVRIEPVHDIMRLSQAIVASSVSMPNVVLPPPIIAEMGADISRQVVGKNSIQPNRKIYLQRKAGVNWQRKIVNEKKIIKYVRSKGFEVVDPVELSIVDQIKLFSEAKIIVSAHGSGLANLIFSRSDCTVIDLMCDTWPENSGYTWIYNLTNIMGLSYVCILGNTKKNVNTRRLFGKNVLNDNKIYYEIDLDRLKHAVESL